MRAYPIRVARRPHLIVIGALKFALASGAHPVVGQTDVARVRVR